MAWEKPWEKRISDTYGYCSYANSLLPFSALLTLKYNNGVTQGEDVCIWPQTHLIHSIRPSRREQTALSWKRRRKKAARQCLYLALRLPSDFWHSTWCYSALSLSLSVLVTWWGWASTDSRSPEEVRSGGRDEGVGEKVKLLGWREPFGPAPSCLLQNKLTVHGHWM